MWAPATTEFMDISFFSFILNGQVQFIMLKRYVFTVDGVVILYVIKII